ncbi:NUDIX domain-containing protein [Patescibacteria group bacterium]|nr:NUDIX domain-containing protein [Patescibacteria group bacterium]MBU4162121.1 NUDIX domain-containing protein [Patescibacteria group bacterium]
MKEKYILEIIKKLGEGLPKFSDGRIDYTNSISAPVLIIFVRYQGEILLLKRSKKVSTYQKKWSVVAGYLDELKPIREKILEELNEETSITEENISDIKFGQSYKIKDDSVHRLWLRFPVLVELKEKPRIKLNFEHTRFKWIKPEEISKFDTPPFFHISWEMLKDQR